MLLKVKSHYTNAILKDYIGKTKTYFKRKKGFIYLFILREIESEQASAREQGQEQGEGRGRGRGRS